MIRNWTTVGAAAIEGAGGRPRVEAAIAGLTWNPMATPAPFSQGYVIRAAIQEFRMPRPSQWGDSHHLAPFGLVGIEPHYTNGRARLYVLDAGSQAIPVCSDFFPEESGRPN